MAMMRRRRRPPNRRTTPGGVGPNALPPGNLPPLPHQGGGVQVASPQARPVPFKPTLGAPQPWAPMASAVGGAAPQPAFAPESRTAPYVRPDQTAPAAQEQAAAPQPQQGQAPMSAEDLAGLTPEMAAFMQGMTDLDAQGLENQNYEDAYGRLEESADFSKGLGQGLGDEHWDAVRMQEEQKWTRKMESEIARERELAVAGGYEGTGTYDQRVNAIREKYAGKIGESRRGTNIDQANMLREDRWRGAGADMQAASQIAGIRSGRQYQGDNITGIHDWLDAKGVYDGQGGGLRPPASTQGKLRTDLAPANLTKVEKVHWAIKYVHGGRDPRNPSQNPSRMSGLGSPLVIGPGNVPFLPGRSRLPFDMRSGWGHGQSPVGYPAFDDLWNP